MSPDILRDCYGFLTSNLSDQIFRFARRHNILEFLPLNQERTEALASKDAAHGSRSTGPANSDSGLNMHSDVQIFGFQTRKRKPGGS